MALGYVALSQGWRWVFWYCTIFMGIITLATIAGLEESKDKPPRIDGIGELEPTTAQPAISTGEHVKALDRLVKKTVASRLPRSMG